MYALKHVKLGGMHVDFVSRSKGFLNLFASARYTTIYMVSPFPSAECYIIDEKLPPFDTVIASSKTNVTD